MATFKCDWIFGLGQQGWEETWYMTTSSIRVAYNSFKDDKTPARMKLLAPGANMKAIRVSDTAVWGDSFLKTFEAGAIISKAGGLTDQANAELLCRVEATSRYRRQMHLRGINDTWLYYEPLIGDFTFNSGAVQPLIDALISTFTSGTRLQIKALSKEGGYERHYIINAVSDALTGIITFTTNDNHGLAANDEVRISLVQYTGTMLAGEVVNGVHTVATAPTATTFTVTGALTTPGWTYIRTKGNSVHKQSYVYQDVTDIIPVRPGTRRAGRPLLVPRGRRSVRR